MKKKRKRKTRHAPGTAPGTVVAHPDALAPTIHLLAYDAERIVERKIARPAELRGVLGRWPVAWVNVDGLGDVSVLHELGEVFGLHTLALEDVANTGQRAKLEEYEEHLFIVLRMAGDSEGDHGEQLSLFLGRNFLLTFQERPGDCFEPVRRRVREGKGRIRRAGPDYLMYALVDAVVDHYFPVLDAISEQLETMEAEIFGAPGEGVLERLQRLKHQLRALRHAAGPQRDVALALLREEAPLVQESTRVYLRDAADHTYRLTESLDTHREIANDLMSAYLTSVSNRMNEIMKVLTIIASIFIPLSFIAGLYGMNFNPQASPWNMPELNWYWGYPALLLLMGSVALGLVLLFRSKGWFD